MALYQDTTQVHQKTTTIFDSIYTPGSAAPYAGIYICTGCGEEIGIAETHVLPSQNHHQHAVGKPPIRWKLLVIAQHLAR